MKVGIDFSISSPAICVRDESTGEFFLYGLSSVLKYVREDPNLFIRRQPKKFKSKMERSIFVSNWAIDVLSQYQDITEILIEGLSFGSKGRALIDVAIHAGVLYSKLVDAGYSPQIVAPKSAKLQFCGNGNASKEVMCEKFTEITGLHLYAVIGCNKADSPENDIVDAFALSHCIFDEKAPSYFNKGD